MPNKPTIILVSIDQLRGWHIATSKDINNFFMSSPNLSELIRDIPNVIKALYKAEHGIEVDVTEGASIDNHNTMPLRYVMETKKAA